MPIANIQDAHEVERGLQTVLTAPDADGRAREIRELFVETLDFDHADLLVALGAANDPNRMASATIPNTNHQETRRCPSGKTGSMDASRGAGTGQPSLAQGQHQASSSRTAQLH